MIRQTLVSLGFGALAASVPVSPPLAPESAACVDDVYEPDNTLEEAKEVFGNSSTGAYVLGSGRMWFCGNAFFQGGGGPKPVGQFTTFVWPAMGTERVIRGGGFDSEARLCRSANRFAYPPDGRYANVGFRIARSND